MTQYYESEVLSKLMERDGFNIPSSVPPYESEIKAYFINQVKQAYPKLTDYEVEWLLYNYTKHLPAEFPTSSVSSVTSATFENVVPFAYQSAILKGNTKYRDIDTGDILDTFDETKNLELVSVKRPGLTTTGKNLFDSNAEINVRQGIDSDNGLPYDNDDHSCSGLLRVESNTTYTITQSHHKTWIFAYNKNKEYIGVVITDVLSGGNFTTPNNTSYIRLDVNTTNALEIVNGVQIEKGATATPYEPYKSNILTVNEPIELRGIGDVRDELDLLTGEKVERIGEIVLDGSENWSRFSENKFHLKIDNWKLASTITTNAKADKINVVPYSQYQSSSLPNISRYNGDNYGIFLYTGGSGWCEDDVTSLKTKLQSNPITVQYELTTGSIKTVDLTVVDQDNQPTKLGTFENVTHVSLEAENLIPEVKMEVATNLLEDTVFNLTSAFNTLYPTAAKPVKSAILKGQTLVNLISDGEVTQNAKNDWVVFSASINVDMIKTSTDYTLITYVISN